MRDVDASGGGQSGAGPTTLAAGVSALRFFVALLCALREER